MRAPGAVNTILEGVGGAALNFLRKVKDGVAHYLRNTDRFLLILCALASVYGVALVYSAAHSAGTGRGGYMTQLIFSIVGFLLAIVISAIDYESICAFWPIWAGLTLLLMILTFTPLGLPVTGADDTAWLGIRIGGREFTFQPSELMKIVFVVTFAKHLTTVREHINRPLTVLLLCLHGALPVALTFKQGDHGTGVVFMLMFVAMMFAAGLKPLYFILAGIGCGVAVPVLWNYLMTHGQDKIKRILSLIFVDEYLNETGWQQYQGLVAMGSGRLWGVGYLNGANYFARNNDFIFTVAGEEFGFIGAIAVIILLLLIIFEIMRCAMAARDRLGMFICVGMMSMIGFQSLINIGMTVRLLPVIGITLPFFSAGGSSVATLYIGIGLVLSVYYSSRARVRNTIFTKKL